MTKEIDDQRAGGKTGETRQTRMHRQMLFWRKGLRQCDGHKARADTHKMFNTEDCAGAFGKAPMADDRFKEVMEGSEPGADRRAKLAEECRRRYLEARGKYDGEIAEGAEDPDRVRTTLLAALDRSKEEGGNAQWEFFRAVGKAKAALAGKKTRPRDGKPGMTAVRRTGEAEPERGTQRVLSAIHDESQKMHQEGGASVAAVLWLVQQMEGAGLPLLTTPAVVDARTHAEATEEGQEASKAQARDEEERTRWREWRREHETRVARLQVLDAEETRTFARHLQGVMGQVMGDEALDEGMRRFREVQGVGLGGFKGIWIARASESTRERYKDALRGAAADVRIAAYELELATTPEERRHAIEAVRIAAPRGWVDWLVVLLTKPGKPLDVLSNRRDIYLQPHSLKLLMNGYTPQYDRAQRRGQPAANTGFRPKGSAPQTAMAMGLAREEAVSERRSWYRGYCDKGGFFQSVARRVQRAAEKRCGVPADVTEVVMALHEALVVRYDSGKGLTPGTESKVGNGQGDSKGPTRSMEPLAIETRAIEWLVAGRSFRTPAGAGRRRVTQVWFADDGAFEVDSFSLLQVMFTVLSTMARALGFSVGIDKDKDGTPNGDKTGWTASEWEGNEHAEADDQTKVRLIDGREVPRAKGWYKHLGVRAQTTNGWGEARAVVVARCTGMAAALARLGIMSAEEYVDTVDTATLTVVAYYGAAFPLGRKACEDIDVAKRRGLERLGHAGTRAARWLVHSQRPEGLGMAMTWPHAAAALVVEMDNAYNAEAQAPARVAAAARTAKVYWQLGWRPTEEARVPLAWNPWHTRDMLSEESIIEAALKYRLTAGVATVAARGDGARNALADGYTTEEGASATLIWEAEGRKYGWRLARLGVTRRRHLYGGTERVARETEDGDIQEQGRWRTATEIGEAFGRGGHVIGGTRRGGRLTAAERAEYVTLLEGLDENKEETDWVTGQRGPPEERPAEATVTEVVAAGKGRRGEREYWMRWSDGEEGWGRRPRTATAGMDREMGRAREAEGEGDLREALTKERGTAWVWLATQAPLAVGRRDTGAIVDEAEKAGVKTAGQEARERGGEATADEMEQEAQEEADRKRKEAEQRADDSEAAEARAGWLGGEEAITAAFEAEAAEEASARAAAHRAVAKRTRAGKGEADTTAGMDEEVARTEAEWVTARARTAAGQLMRHMTTWAKARPEYKAACTENAEGAGAAAEKLQTTKPASFRPSKRIACFFGEMGRPDEDGKCKLTPSLKTGAKEAAEAGRVAQETPKIDAAYEDPRVAWGEEERMWTGKAAPATQEGGTRRDAAGEKGAERSARSREQARRRREERKREEEKAEATREETARAARHLQKSGATETSASGEGRRGEEEERTGEGTGRRRVGQGALQVRGMRAREEARDDTAEGEEGEEALEREEQEEAEAERQAEEMMRREEATRREEAEFEQEEELERTMMEQRWEGAEEVRQGCQEQALHRAQQEAEEGEAARASGRAGEARRRAEACMRKVQHMRQAATKARELRGKTREAHDETVRRAEQAEREERREAEGLYTADESARPMTEFMEQVRKKEKAAERARAQRREMGERHHREEQEETSREEEAGRMATTAMATTAGAKRAAGEGTDITEEEKEAEEGERRREEKCSRERERAERKAEEAMRQAEEQTQETERARE
jgi:hypothetical protein